MHNVDDGPSHNASLGFRVDVHREREGLHVGVVLPELDVLDEEGGRLHDAAFGANQRARVCVEVDAAFE